jgi:hypothetical protein
MAGFATLLLALFLSLAWAQEPVAWGFGTLIRHIRNTISHPETIDWGGTLNCGVRWASVITCITGGGGPLCLGTVPKNNQCYQYLSDLVPR